MPDQPGRSFAARAASAISASHRCRLDRAFLALIMSCWRRIVRYELPALIGLEDFRAEFYPGTDTPRSFESDVILEAPGTRRPVRISMNKPLRFSGFTFYQASYVRCRGRRLLDPGGGGEPRPLRARRPLHRVRAPRSRGLASAAALRPLIVIEDGRPKPLDSYARYTLLRYSGRERYAGQSIGPAVNNCAHPRRRAAVIRSTRRRDSASRQATRQGARRGRP